MKKVRNVNVLQINHTTMALNVLDVNSHLSGTTCSTNVKNVEMDMFTMLMKMLAEDVLLRNQSKIMEFVLLVLIALTLMKTVEFVFSVLKEVTLITISGNVY